jgi:tetratricopeptide (TPR) repeat protein
MIVQELREDARTRSRVSPELEKVKEAAEKDFRKYHSSADPDRERVLYVKALLEYLGQRLESAFEMTSRLVAMGTNNEEVWFLRGLISWGLAREGELARYADAKKEFSEAIRKRVNYFDAYNSRGNMLAEQGDLEGAILDFTRSTRINPSFADAHANLGTCLVSLGRTAEGIPFLEEALRIREDHVQAMVNLGLAYKVQKNYEKALELVDRGLELAPEYANGFSIRGTVRRAAGDLPGAIRDYTEAIRLLPENPIAYVNRATVHGDLKDWESARADNDRFLARSRGGDLHWFDVHYNQGIFCYRLGEDRKALRYLEVAATDPRLREKALGWILRLKKRLGE